MIKKSILTLVITSLILAGCGNNSSTNKTSTPLVPVNPIPPGPGPSAQNLFPSHFTVANPTS